ncbi:MAG TPA: hypothetical protein VLX29_12120 [Nitrospirota bacterium]|nr:hypothetical protein [Nitrospirota bacterium]
MHVKLVDQIKLLPTSEQLDALKSTLFSANAACNYVSEQAWQTKTFKQYDRITYPTSTSEPDLASPLKLLFE